MKKLLDLFCGAGGAGMGYHRAGFEVVGIDNRFQKHYPFEFHQADALEYLAEHAAEFDVIHASPPCQRYSHCTPPQYRKNHPDLIEALRIELLKIKKPFIIENVNGAKRILINPIMLCGTMFGLNIERHRYFEINPEIFSFLPPCKHDKLPVLITGTTRRKTGRFEYRVEDCRKASGLVWMTRKEMDEAIPPAYTEWIGRQLIRILEAE
jgi:DNA (cytosine-5)-methyltransferase 1